jgi:hypothetical protein
MGSHWIYDYGAIAVWVLVAIPVVFWMPQYTIKRMFKTAPNGERLFYGRGRSRPYIVPDSATERRLYRKVAWFWRTLLSTQCIILLYADYPAAIGFGKNLWQILPLYVSLAILALLVLGLLLNLWFLLRGLRGLRRAEA